MRVVYSYGNFVIFRTGDGGEVRITTPFSIPTNDGMCFDTTVTENGLGLYINLKEYERLQPVCSVAHLRC